MFNPVVALLFRIINLAALVGLIAYIYKRYLRSTLEEQVAEQEAIVNGRNQQLYALQARLEELETQKNTLIKHGKQLEQKVLRWKEQVLKEHDHYAQEQKAWQQHATQRSAIQQEYLNQKLLLARVAPEAIDQVVADLERHYQDPKAKAHYLQHVVTTLTKR